MSIDPSGLKSIIAGLLLGVTTSLAQTPTPGCTIDTWAATSTADAPTGRSGHTAVWTGSEMIVWGGSPNDGNTVLNTGARYNPATDSWTPTSITNAPAGRYYHTAVWTGSEMIVWGGSASIVGPDLNTGARYNPSTDSWTVISAVNAPTGRSGHTAVWTGSEMIVWGGFVYTGGRYNPSTDTWTSTSTANAPSARYLHTVLWTGQEMIVWGGRSTSSGNPLDTGGKYNPAMDIWRSTTLANGPGRRGEATAVWTGSKMIVWGGWSGQAYLNSGREYNPEMDSWTGIGTANAPTARSEQTAVWTGTEMIVWGGYAGLSGLDTGGRYDPANGSWTVTSTIDAPAGRKAQTAVWTGSEMIVWGGRQGNVPLNTGGRYCVQASATPSPTPALTATPTPASTPTQGCTGDAWISTSSAPTIRSHHTAVWTGSEMIVWGGYFYDNTGHYLNTGWKYDRNTNGWTTISAINAPTGRSDHTTIWTGSEMIVWGGYFSDSTSHYLNTGGRYNPATDSWVPTSTSNAPTGRSGHAAVWTGSEMIVWGSGGSGSNTGGRYNPSTDSWIPTSTINAPVGGKGVWTGSEMIVWGGNVNSGGRYSPGTDSWNAISNTNAPVGQPNYTLVWTGSEMIVWGGTDNTNYFNIGASYNPMTNSWRATSTINAPAARFLHTALWTGREMIVWGGVTRCYVNGCETDTGGKYDPVTDSWTATSITDAPFRRANHTAVWTDSEMIIWGGASYFTYLNNGGRYCAQPPPTPTPTPMPTPMITISATVLYCSNPSLNPVPGVILTLSGDATTSTLSDDSGNYQFSSLASGGSYTVTPTKAALPPGSAGINTTDVVATQRHFLIIGTPLTGCRFAAADVNGDTAVNTVDVTAMQRFFLGLTTGTASTGKYQFSPANRTYPRVVSDQIGQNYDTLIFGDVASPFAE